MIKEIKNYAKELGFDLFRIIKADPLPKEAKHFKNWLKQGFEGDMEYMDRDPEKRTNPQKILPGAKSIICLGMNYYQEGGDSDFKIARYAFGKDYHKVIEKKLKKLRQFIIKKNPSLTKKDFKLYTDAGPILERAYAVQAGFGFIGKNTTLITPDFGSWIFLAEIITTLAIERTFSKKELSLRNCGSCDRCIKACPTGALTKPYQLDARKCISYQTIENKGKINVDIKDRVFGCDICQEVCPHNCRAKSTTVPEFTNHIAGPNLNPEKIEAMSEEEFQQKFSGSPLKRAGLKNLKRNIKKCYTKRRT